MQSIITKKTKNQLFGFVLVVLFLLSVFYILSISMSVPFNDGSAISSPVSISESPVSFKKITNLQLVFLGKISHDKLSFNIGLNENFTKKTVIHELIVQTPGITLREIQRRTGFALGVIQYHINRFDDSDIESLYLGRCKHFFGSRPHFSATEKTGLAAVRNQKIRSILHCINSKNQARRQKDIAEETGLSKFLVSYYIKQLKQLGIVNHNGHCITINSDYQFLVNTHL